MAWTARHWSAATITLAAALAAPGTVTSQQRQPQQVVNPAPVNYWMDVSTGERGGGGGFMGGLAGMMAGRGGGDGGSGGGFAGFGGSDNWFGAAQTNTAGRFVDIAVFDRRRPGQVRAQQAVPTGAQQGATLPLLPPPPPAPNQPSPWDEPRREMPQDGERRDFRMVIKYYWGCGPTVREGQPRTATFDTRNMQSYGQFLQGRSERDRGATSNNRSSTWPNRESHRAWQPRASLAGDHAVTGEGLPASLRFQIGAAQDFMGELGLRASGSPTGVVTLNWTGLPTATAYFANANGFEVDADSGGEVSEMTMIFWSASQTPDPGDGLLGFLSNANQDRFLADRTLLPVGTTTCQIPAGIFARTQMITINGVAYGRELNLVHPARPTDPRVPWNQEWTARVRVKSASSIMMMPGMGNAVAAGPGRSSSAPAAPDPSLTPEQQAAADLARRQQACDEARERQRRDAANVGGAVGGLAGRALGGLVGARSQPPECEGLEQPRRRRN
jgi:hypothetical protein